MRIEAFLLCWNEIDIMPLVIKHYQKFCDKITILDNYSTDGSAELAKSLGCEVKQFGTKFFDDHENRDIKNNIWKGVDADWVIVADFDEILHLPRMVEETIKYGKNELVSIDTEPLLMCKYLQYMSESFDTIIPTYGWQIMSEEMPKNDLLEITNGYHFKNYSKSIIFNPKEITEINYGLGAHDCDPKGNVVWSNDSLYVLHYKHIGGLQRTINRYNQYKPRMSKFNRKHGHGKHYNRSVASLRQEWAERMKISKPLI